MVVAASPVRRMPVAKGEQQHEGVALRRARGLRPALVGARRQLPDGLQHIAPLRVRARSVRRIDRRGHRGGQPVEQVHAQVLLAPMAVMDAPRRVAAAFGQRPGERPPGWIEPLRPDLALERVRIR